MDQKDSHWIGFDLGGTKMMAVVYDAEFKPLGRARKKTKGRDGMEAGLKRINNLIGEAIDEAGLKPEQVCGLGIGCPGPLDLKERLIRTAPNLGWHNVPIARSIEKQYPFPVRVFNDVDSGVFGEYKFGAGQHARCVFGLFPGTGIGGGCVYEGKVFRGSNCTCMEIGHIPLIPQGPLDGAGNPGTLEAVASRLSIAGAAAQACYRGQAPFLLEKSGTDVSKIRSAAIAASVEHNDQAVVEIIDHACGYLALSVVTIVHLLAPDVIVFGGGLIEALGDRMLPAIEKQARARVLPSLKDVFKIELATLGDDAGVMGAAALARQSILEG